MYTAKNIRSTSQSNVVEIGLTAQYPSLELCKSPPVALNWPWLNYTQIDPAVYPYNLENIYPAKTVPIARSQHAGVRSEAQNVVLSSISSYPHLEICTCLAKVVVVHHGNNRSSSFRSGSLSVELGEHLSGYDISPHFPDYPVSIECCCRTFIGLSRHTTV